jgi:DNA-directed RNA polymerase specialized sigma24 family protein
MSDSISEWICNLKSGDPDAAQNLWNRYSRRLIDEARRQLRRGSISANDDEDVAQSVFTSICRSAAAGRLENVKSRDELWWILLAFTKQKTVDRIRRTMARKRGYGRTLLESAVKGGASDSSAFSLDQLIGCDLTPEYIVALDEQFSLLLEVLDDDRMRKIATLRVEGFTVPEIAGQLDLSTRSVERKLQIIRFAWARELQA